MKSGKLKYRVSIQRQVQTQDAVGQLNDSWVELASRRASIEPLQGRDFFRASGEHIDITTRIRLRWETVLQDLTPADRIVDEAFSPQVEYKIISVINSNRRNHELICMCRQQFFTD